MPPSAAQRLIQRRRIGKAIGLSLDQVDPSLLIQLLSAQKRNQAITVFVTKLKFAANPKIDTKGKIHYR